MRGFCPSCENESELTRIQRKEVFNIKGEQIPVDVELFACLECGEEFDDSQSETDPLVVAYHEYRNRKGMVQPEEIRALRDHYNLTQQELSRLLGFGGATLSRYENHALQDETHDTILRLILEPTNLLRMIREKGGFLNDEKRKQITQQLESEIDQAGKTTYLQHRGYGPVDIFSGHQALNLSRLLGVVKAFCYQTNVYKTKLNKLLFYADFKHFQQNGKSITGVRYAHYRYGPVPDQYEILYQYLLEMDPTLIKEEDSSRDCAVEVFRSETAPDMTMFSYSELSVIEKVKQNFQHHTATELTDLSHQEEGYLQTRHRQIISYDFAEQLKI